MSQKRIAAAGLVYTIDLRALVQNWTELASRSRPAECAAVVKANAYGIGIEHAVPALWQAGCRSFFVALPEEGQRAREAAPGAAIYVLNGYLPDWGGYFRDFRLRPVLSSLASIEAWAEHFAGEPSGVQVDTGMNRLGLSLREARELARRTELVKKAGIELLVSHFVISEEPAHPLNAAQIALFREIRAELPQLRATLANSAGIHLGPDYHFDLVRAGIALYGAEFSPHWPPLETVVSARARLLQIRHAAAGETVGYGATRRLEEDTRIAILSAGYADGYHRLTGSLSGRPGAFVLIRGQPAPLLGRVSMDLIAADVTRIAGAMEGDWAELFGAALPIDTAAHFAGTIGYEFLTQLSTRAERVYINDAVNP